MHRYDTYFGQNVTEAEVDEWFDGAEQADWYITADQGLTGVVEGFVVGPHTPADLSVDVTEGTAYDPDGKRVRVNATQVIDLSIDWQGVSTEVLTPSNEKILSIFLLASRTLTDIRIDDNSIALYYSRGESFDFKVVQGSEALPPAVPAALESDKVLLADVRIAHNQTAITAADITPTYTGHANRRQDSFVLTFGSDEIRSGTAVESDQAILDEVTAHLVDASGAHDASAIAYDVGPSWHDGQGNPATDVKDQLDKIVVDLISTAGSDKIGGAGYTGNALTVSGGSIQDQIRAMLDGLPGLARANAFTAANSFADPTTFNDTVAINDVATLTSTLVFGAGSKHQQREGTLLGTSGVTLYTDVDWYRFTTAVVTNQTYTLNITGGTAAQQPVDGSTIEVTMTISGAADAIFEDESTTELARFTPGGGATAKFRYSSAAGAWKCVAMGGTATMTVPH